MKRMFINCTSRETRIALIENGSLVEILLERPEDRRIVGNIYRGRVANVLPGMQSAFVDIGLSKNGFLYIDDCLPAAKQEVKIKPNIRELVREGQEVLVQVTKEAFGTKGPRVTTHVSIPGRYLVYMPDAKHIGISRKIENEEEKQRLRILAESLIQGEEGIIVRTVASGIQEAELRADYEHLRALWQHAIATSKTTSIPALIYREQGLIHRVLRDYMNEDVAEIWIDDAKEYRTVQHLVGTISESYGKRVKLYTGKENIFSAFEIEGELEKALRRQVWLKCGGYLIIDQTEALTIIDVNTGKFIGKNDQEQTVLKTNLEATKEAARQLRLRDIGGIILIDFIDMHEPDHQAQVLASLHQEMRQDRTKFHILGITRLGLVEMTRKKVKQNILDAMKGSCKCCEGTGKVLSPESISYQVERTLWEYRRSDIEGVLLEMHQTVLEELQKHYGDHLQVLAEEIGFKIFVRSNANVHPEHFEILYMGTESEIRRRIPLTER